MPSSKKAISFDLDGTLTESKSPMTAEMSALVCQLLEKYYVAVISGGSFPQFQKQILSNLPTKSEEILSRLLLFPTNGSALYMYKDGAWDCLYEEKLTQEEKNKIIDAWDKALVQSGVILPTPSYGPVMEDRGTQISFSACGQQAPIAVKATWDPNQTERTAIREYMLPLLPEFAISFGGMTSTDVTRAGIDKAHAIEKMMEYLKVLKDDIMFIGDKLDEGGNDYPAKRTGVECVATTGPENTAELIKKLIAEK